MLTDLLYVHRTRDGADDQRVTCVRILGKLGVAGGKQVGLLCC